MHTKTTAKSELTNSIVGYYAHSFYPDGTIRNQMRVVCKINDENYVVKLFSFIDGSETNMELISLSGMRDWNLYETHEHMNSWYEANAAKLCALAEEEAATS